MWCDIKGSQGLPDRSGRSAAHTRVHTRANFNHMIRAAITAEEHILTLALAVIYGGRYQREREKNMSGLSTSIGSEGSLHNLTTMIWLGLSVAILASQHKGLTGLCYCPLFWLLPPQGLDNCLMAALCLNFCRRCLCALAMLLDMWKNDERSLDHYWFSATSLDKIHTIENPKLLM